MRDKNPKEHLPKFTISSIVDAICDLYNVNKNHLIGRVRTADIVVYRAVIVAISRENGKSFTQIGRILGRDHSSVIHLHQKYAGRKEVIEIVERVMPYLKGAEQ